MGSIKTSSDSNLKKFISKYVEIDELDYDSTHEEVVDILNVLVEDYKARYHD